MNSGSALSASIIIASSSVKSFLSIFELLSYTLTVTEGHYIKWGIVVLDAPKGELKMKKKKHSMYLIVFSFCAIKYSTGRTRMEVGM